MKIDMNNDVNMDKDMNMGNYTDMSAYVNTDTDMSHTDIGHVHIHEHKRIQSPSI
jgi:hypothetical protein